MDVDGACPWCEQNHERGVWCAQAQAVLAALAARAAENNMPTVEFDEPVSLPPPLPAGELNVGLGLGAADVLMRQVVAQAGVVEVAGRPRPVLILTGRDSQGAPLPRWVYVGTVEDMRRTRNLVRDMADLAIRRADVVPR